MFVATQGAVEAQGGGGCRARGFFSIRLQGFDRLAERVNPLWKLPADLGKYRIELPEQRGGAVLVHVPPMGHAAQLLLGFIELAPGLQHRHFLK